MHPTSGSAAYRLSSDERAVIHTATGKRYPLWGRKLDLYRALSYARGHCLTELDLLAIVWQGIGDRNNVSVNVRNLRRKISADVIENVRGYGYIVR